MGVVLWGLYRCLHDVVVGVVDVDIGAVAGSHRGACYHWKDATYLGMHG